jgi:TalC/MipB family fructose-6-phosphate aldolase
MKFFADTADVAELRELKDLGLLDGVTTNPSLIAKSGRKFTEVIAEICSFVEGPVSAEVAALDFDGMMKEANVLRKIAKNVTVKVPLTLEGLKACRVLSGEGTMVNVTLCFSANQALLVPLSFRLLWAAWMTFTKTAWNSLPRSARFMIIMITTPTFWWRLFAPPIISRKPH